MQGIVKGGLNNGGSNIKSQQAGRTLINATTINVTIVAVDLTKTIVRVAPGLATTAGMINQYIFGAVLTSPTNLQITVNDSAKNVTVAWEVIEFNNVKSLQSGTTVTAGALSTNQAITSVNPLKSILFYSSTDSDAATNPEFMVYNGYINTATQLVFKQGVSTLRTIYWYLVEFN